MTDEVISAENQEQSLPAISPHKVVSLYLGKKIVAIENCPAKVGRPIVNPEGNRVIQCTSCDFTENAESARKGG